MLDLETNLHIARLQQERRLRRAALYSALALTLPPAGQATTRIPLLRASRFLARLANTWVLPRPTSARSSAAASTTRRR